LLVQKTELKAPLHCILQSRYSYIPVHQGRPNTRSIPLPGTPSEVSLSGVLPRKLQPAAARVKGKKAGSQVLTEGLAQYHFH